MSTTTAAVTANPSCWTSFTNGVSAVGSTIWAGIQKVGLFIWAALQRAAFYCSIGFAAAVAFVKAHVWQFLVGGACLGAGVALGLLFARMCGWCNKAPAAPAAPTGTEGEMLHNLDIRA